MTKDDAIAARTVPVDTPCVNCNYNLRGAELSSKCPECGRPVRESGVGVQLSQAPMPWLQSVNWGLWLVVVSPFAGLALGAIALLVIVVLPGVPSRWWLFTTVGAGAGGWVLRVLLVLVIVQISVGTLLLTYREPRIRFEEPPLSLRRVLRLAGVPLLLCAAQTPLVIGSIGMSWLPYSISKIIGDCAILSFVMLLGLHVHTTMRVYGLLSAARSVWIATVGIVVSGAVLFVAEYAVSTGTRSTLQELWDYGVLQAPSLVFVLVFWCALEYCRREVVRAIQLVR